MATDRPGVTLVSPALISGAEGGERFRVIVRADPNQPVAVEAISEEEPYVFAALQLGARGCLLSEWTAAERSAALQELDEGGVVLTPYLARCVLVALTRPLPAGWRRTAPELTEPEAAILHAIGRGVANRDVAAVLGLQHEMVREYLRGALQKLQQERWTDGPDLHGSGVPRRPSPGRLVASAEAAPAEERT